MLQRNCFGRDGSLAVNHAIDNIFTGGGRHCNQTTIGVDYACIADELLGYIVTDRNFQKTVAIEIYRCRIAGSQMHTAQTRRNDTAVFNTGCNKAN